MEEPVNQENIRNSDGTYKKGFTGNPNGRPKGQTMKEYVSVKFRTMTPEEKEEWLKEHKLSPELIWKMAEGNPKQDVQAEIELESKIISIDE